MKRNGIVKPDPYGLEMSKSTVMNKWESPEDWEMVTGIIIIY